MLVIHPFTPIIILAGCASGYSSCHYIGADAGAQAREVLSPRDINCGWQHIFTFRPTNDRTEHCCTWMAQCNILRHRKQSPRIILRIHRKVVLKSGLLFRSRPKDRSTVSLTGGKLQQHQKWGTIGEIPAGTTFLLAQASHVYHWPNTCQANASMHRAAYIS